mgnify:FL=1
MGNIKIPTILNYNSNDNENKSLSQVNKEISNLIKIRKELRSVESKLIRDKTFYNKLELYKDFI